MSMKVSVSGNFDTVFKELLRRWPSVKYGLLSHIGYKGRSELYTGYLKGRVIHLRQYRLDVRGYHTVAYSIARNRQSVRISSYPLNLYDPRSVYNSASSSVSAAINASLAGYDQRVLQKRINQISRIVGK